MIPYYGTDPDYSLKEKTAVITGGAAGIGYATAAFFSKKGVYCVLADQNSQTDQIAKGLGDGHLGIIGDLTSEAYRQSVIKAAIKRFGKIDILVNSAGIVALDRAESISTESWQRTLDINLTASFKMAQTVGKYMIDHKAAGVIINIASQAGIIALDKHIAYCASKAAIISITKVLAFEWGKYGIRVNCVSPTVVMTELGRKAWDGPAGEAFKKEMPAERFAEPDEIASTIAFLCSNGAAMITGHNLVIDGGYTIK
ncbi:MAG: GolD/DthD family dehydrogenase [Christensenellales bacterium]